MKNDPLKQYAKLRQQLIDEKSQLEARLAEINAVLEPEGVRIPSSSLDRISTEYLENLTKPTKSRRGRKPSAGNTMPLREAVVKALSNGPLGRKDLVKAVEGVGYRFNTRNPLNSIGSVLYDKKGPIKSKGGKFYLPGSAAPEASTSKGDVPAPANIKKRRMSAAGKARIAAAARAMWAKRKAGK